MLNNFVYLLLAGDDAARPQWISDSFPIIQGILVAVMSLLSIVMIIAILASPPESGSGTNAVTGASESYYTKHKGHNNLGRIRNLIIICGVIIAVFTVIYFILYGIFNLSGTAS